MTRFCIVTPSYNQVQFLEQTVESVLSQHGPFEVEYLVMDGGSSDGSRELLEKLSRKYTGQFSFESKKDRGQSDAINKGLRVFLQREQRSQSKRQSQVKQDNSHATTPVAGLSIFAYVNSDDYYLPGTFESVERAFLDFPDRMWAVGDAEIVSETGARIQEPVRWYKRFLRWVYQPWMLLVLNPLPQPAVFVRLEAVKELGAFSEKLHYTMDYEYWLRLQGEFGAPLRLGASLAAFRVHGESKGGSAFEQQFKEEQEVSRLYTNNSVLLTLHRAHNILITTVYRMIK
jgi:glycosyltransferase involved in cell wall biosynthesis